MYSLISRSGHSNFVNRFMACLKQPSLTFSSVLLDQLFLRKVRSLIPDKLAITAGIFCPAAASMTFSTGLLSINYFPFAQLLLNILQFSLPLQSLIERLTRLGDIHHRSSS